MSSYLQEYIQYPVDNTYGKHIGLVCALEGTIESNISGRANIFVGKNNSKMISISKPTLKKTYFYIFFFDILCFL